MSNRLREASREVTVRECTVKVRDRKLKQRQSEDRNLQDEINDLKLTQNKAANLSKLSAQQIQQLEDEIKRLKTRINDLETEILDKKKEVTAVRNKHREEITSLTNEHQQASRKIRELQAEVTSLHAKEPEVVTKIKKVQVEIESEELKKSFTECKMDKEKLQTELEALQSVYSECENSKTSLQNEVQSLHKSYSVCRAEKEAMNIKLAGLRKEYSDLTEQMSSVQSQKDQCSEELNILREEKEKLEEKMKQNQIQAEKDKEEAVIAAKQEMMDSYTQLQVKYEKICHKISLIEPLYSELIEAYILLEKQAKQFPKLIKDAVSQVRKQMCKAIAGINDYNKELLRKYHMEMQLRKKYHNELVELKGNIRVFCRVRPSITEDGGGPMSETVVDFDRDDDCLLYVKAKGRTQTFEMDRVFSQSSTQTEVFDEVKALVTSCIDGYNVCIFAYGQTGAGKTFTMEGTTEQPGINQRALQELFRETSDKGKDWSYTITVSVIEIYNETIRDLLMMTLLTN
ncbi:hypothetical protein KUTeg_019477 [Tegillarca granosa]|uniref:Kinesin motor domain-containing protein n=1 Tax=Tegillarca granosa TaxID=220873 RepID=A0ABQ9ECL0_TEGGR|nr:hypothetical protein KUTeg_019477 [Tegillarca granosa]